MKKVEAIRLFRTGQDRTGAGKGAGRSVGRVFEKVGQKIAPKIQLGTHSMRKTRGYAMFEAGRSIESICNVLNHSSPAVTMRYIGIEQRDIDQSYHEFEL